MFGSAIYIHHTHIDDFLKCSSLGSDALLPSIIRL